jgi:membrane protein required for colicin V production
MMDFSMIDFNYFDVTIAAIVLILGIKGFMHGFIKEVFGLLGLVGGVYLASRFADSAATFIDQNFMHLEDASIMKLIGFMVVLLAVWLVASILGALFSKLSSESGLGPVNRLLGFIVGGGKYFLIFALIVTALSNVKLVQDNLEPYFKTSVLYPYLQEVGSYLMGIDNATLGLNLADTNATEALETSLDALVE